MYLFQSALGNVGEGKLHCRESARMYGVPETEQCLYYPDATKLDRFYADLALLAASTQVITVT